MRPIKLKDAAAAGLAVLLCFGIVAGCVTSKRAEASPAPYPAPAALKPTPTDGRIAFWTARLLEEFHYLQEPLDTAMSKKFFDGYVEMLDPNHEDFLQSDLAEFAVYRTNLDTFTLGRHNTADLTPAFVIFERLVERMEQHTAYVDQLLHEDRFKFTGDDRLLLMAQVPPLERPLVPYPKDLDAAKELWRQHLRYEYLQEKLSRETSETNDTVINLPKSAAEEIASTLERHYRWNLQVLTNWDSDSVLQIYLEALAHAYDPHSDYLNTSHAQDFAIGMNLSLFGIGAQLSEDDGYCTISSLVPGGPAALSKKLHEKDRIIGVAQSNQPPVNVVDMDLTKVVQMIRGPKGTDVRLTISPADDRTARRVVSLIRDEIKLTESEAKARLVEAPDGRGGTNRLGVVEVPSFYATVDLPSDDGQTTEKSTTADVTRLIKRLEQEKVSGIVLDLRNNPGGSLEEAIKFTGLFVKEGPVVLARNSDGRIQVDSDTDPDVLYGGPLVVLANRFSASASEIVAAALQDYGRALIVGDPFTFGKGTVQNLNPLRPFIMSAPTDPGVLKITIRKFYRVSGGSTQWRGVLSDLVLPDVLSYRNDLESERTLENSLPYDTIPDSVLKENNVLYNKLNLVQPYLYQLGLDSQARVATNQDFIYIRQDIAELEKIQAEKTVTLNEREALKERERILARDKARDAERNARPAPRDRIYELTVENCGTPGLPAPLLETNEVAVAGSTNVPPAEVEKVSTPPQDPFLKETENILTDYISLLSKNGIMIANH